MLIEVVADGGGATGIGGMLSLGILSLRVGDCCCEAVVAPVAVGAAPLSDERG